VAIFITRGLRNLEDEIVASSPMTLVKLELEE